MILFTLNTLTYKLNNDKYYRQKKLNQSLSKFFRWSK